jgi:hypothetical protein
LILDCLIRKSHQNLCTQVTKVLTHGHLEQPKEESPWRWEAHHGQTSENSLKQEVLKYLQTSWKLIWEQATFFFDNAMIKRFQTVFLKEVSMCDL